MAKFPRLINERSLPPCQQSVESFHLYRPSLLTINREIDGNRKFHPVPALAVSSSISSILQNWKNWNNLKTFWDRPPSINISPSSHAACGLRVTCDLGTCGRRRHRSGVAWRAGWFTGWDAPRGPPPAAPGNSCSSRCATATTATGWLPSVNKMIQLCRLQLSNDSAPIHALKIDLVMRFTSFIQGSPQWTLFLSKIFWFFIYTDK
jgi:hypothetical protein